MFLFLFIILFLILLLASPLIVGVVFLCQKHTTTGATIVGVYLLLIISFLIYGHLERRSTVGHIARWLGGEGELKQNANDLAEDAKKTINPSELQLWAVTILHEPQPTNSDFEYPRNKVLPSIQNLKSSGFEFEMVNCDSADSVPDQERSVWIVWGGGLGHWGIRVGSPAFKINNAVDDNYYVEWKPGIYFWGETH
jgi:hypothetical protein